MSEAVLQSRSIDVVDTLRLELRCRNNVLWHAVFDTYGSVAHFCIAHGFTHTHQVRLGRFLNLKESPYLGDSHDLKPFAVRLCDATGLSPYELFNPDLYSGGFSNVVSEVHHSHAISLLQAPRRSILLPPNQENVVEQREQRSALLAVLKTLTPREEMVLTRRFGIIDGEEQTLEEVGEVLGVTRSRVSGIEAKALRKLRHPSRLRTLIPFSPFRTITEYLQVVGRVETDIKSLPERLLSVERQTPLKLAKPNQPSDAHVLEILRHMRLPDHKGDLDRLVWRCVAIIDVVNLRSGRFSPDDDALWPTGAVDPRVLKVYVHTDPFLCSLVQDRVLITVLGDASRN